MARLTTVHAEYLVVNHHGKRQEVEHIREICPNMGRVVFSDAFRVEPVRLGKKDG
jgi:hypothetical protein